MTDQPEVVAYGSQQGTVVADQHHGAFELVQRHGECLARGQVEMVGRLIQQQQVGALPDDHGQHQPGFFAATHAAHALRHHVAAELEAAEEVAQVLLAAGLGSDIGVGLGQADHVAQRGVVQLQHVQLLLGEIAQTQALAFGDASCQQGQGVGDGFDEGGLALAVGAEHADALARQHGAVHIAQDHRVARSDVGQCLASLQLVLAQHVTGAEVFYFSGIAGVGRHVIGATVAEAGIADCQHGVGQLRRLLKFEGEVRTGQHRCEALHALQCLDTALRLLGLGGLGLEAVDELLQMGDLFLLTRIGGLLQGDLLRPHFLEGSVVAAVAVELGVLDMHCDLRDGVEEFAVVADDEQSAGIALEPAFQPDQGVQVQVVGGFVEQQQIARAHQRARQLQTHAPAAGEAVDGLVQLVDLESQAKDQRLRTR